MKQPFWYSIENSVETPVHGKMSISSVDSGKTEEPRIISHADCKYISSLQIDSKNFFDKPFNKAKIIVQSGNTITAFLAPKMSHNVGKSINSIGIPTK